MDGKYSTEAPMSITTVSVVSKDLNLTSAESLVAQNFSEINCSWDKVPLLMVTQNSSEINCSSDDEPILFSNVTALSTDNRAAGTVFECVLLFIGIAGIIANGLMLIGRLCFV